MYVVNQCINRCTDYNVLCLLKDEYNVDPEKYGSKQLEHKLAEILLPESIGRLEQAAIKRNKNIVCEVVGDRDVKWTEIVDTVSSQVKTVSVKKIDDINHALGKIYSCVKESKNSLPKEDRRDSGLSTNFADHLYTSVHRGLIAKPDAFKCYIKTLLFRI